MKKDNYNSRMALLSFICLMGLIVSGLFGMLLLSVAHESYDYLGLTVGLLMVVISVKEILLEIRMNKRR